MKTLDYNAVLKDLQYKPNFAFGAYEREGKWWIRVIMLVENARAPFQRWEVQPAPVDHNQFTDYDWYRSPKLSGSVGYSPSRELIEVMGNYVIPPFAVGEEEAFIDWFGYVVHKVEDHEIDEWLRYKGELIRDPHEEN